MKAITPHNTTAVRYFLLARYGTRKARIELVGTATSPPFDNPVWLKAMRDAHEWWLVLAPYVRPAERLASLWPAHSSDAATGSKIINHGVNKT